MADVRIKRLSTDEIAVYNPDTQEMILVPSNHAAEFGSAKKADAWGQAQKMASAGKAKKLAPQDVKTATEALNAVVLLRGSNDWPP
jgi:hypothetical protein